MAIEDLSGIGGIGAGGITGGGSGGSGGIALIDVANSDTVEYRNLSLGEATTKALTLSGVPLVDSKVIMDLVEGPPLKLGVDYSSTGGIISWTGLALDGKLVTGEQLRITYLKA